MKVSTFSVPLLLLFLALPLPGQENLVPDDYDGLLVRDDFTATMRGGDLEVTVTAMDDRIISYATKEMRDHFRKMKEDLLADDMYYRPNDKNRAVPFLVNFRALGQEVRYEPHELVIFNYGQEYKPLEIVPVSPNFNDRVTFIRKPPVSAIYLFDRGIDLNSRELTIVYYNSLTFNNWLRVIEKLNEAKAQYEVYRARNLEKK